MNKETYLYKNRKIIIVGILFFLMCLAVLTTVINSKADDNIKEFTLDKNAKTVDIDIQVKQVDIGVNKNLSNVGLKLALEDSCTGVCWQNNDYQFKAYAILSKKDSGYEIDEYTDKVGEATQLKTDSNGKIQLVDIPKGVYLIYESLIAEKNAALLGPIEVVVEESEDDDGLKVSVNSKGNNIKVEKDDYNKINVTFEHKVTKTEYDVAFPRLGCLAMSATPGYIVEGVESSFDVEKSVYPPTVKEWEAELKVGAYLDDTDDTLTANYFNTIEDYSEYEHDETYTDFLKEKHSDSYQQYYSKYEEYLKENYEDAYESYMAEKEEDFESLDDEDYNSLDDYCKDNCYSLEEYSVDFQEADSFKTYLKENYADQLAFYDYYIDYLEEKYGTEYDNYVTDHYEIIKFYQRTNSSYTTKKWSVCVEPEVAKKSSGKMYVDIVEDTDKYVASYSSNLAGLTQDGNRYYGTVNNITGHELEVNVVNWDKNYGDLQITKRLFEDAGTEKFDKEFSFKIVLTAPKGKEIPNEYLYTVNGNTAYQKLTFTTEKDNTKTATIKIKAGSTIRLIGLLTGTTYKVIEVDSQGYKVNAKNTEGIIEGAKITDAYFTNTKINTGLLVVTKKVIGTAEDKEKEFTFTVTLSDKEINGVYGEMNFKDGVATFTLKDGETKTAINIPEGTTYEVKEKNTKGYVASYEGNNKAIQDGLENRVVVTNSKTVKLPNTADKILVVFLVLIISLGVLVYFKVNKKYMV